MYYIGIDLSLSGTGIVVLDKDSNIFLEQLSQTNSKDSIEDRFLKIEKDILMIIDNYCPRYINIEGLSFSSNGQSTLDLAGLHFVIRTTLRKNNIPFNVTSPGSLKKFITGKGNAKKNLMLKEVYKKWGVDLSDDNICDAFCLAKMEINNINNN